MKNGQRIILGVMSSILILLFSIVGCSDPSRPGPLTSYTGSMLTPLNVDDYLTTIRGGTYCIHKDTDSSCIDLIPLVNSGGDTNKGPIIHIYPEKTVYLFYHEGKPIVRVERIGDTTDIVNTLGDPNQDPNGDDGDNGDGGNGGNGNGDGGNDGNGDGGNGDGGNGGNGDGGNGGNGEGGNGGDGGNGDNGDGGNGDNGNNGDGGNGGNGDNGNGGNGDNGDNGNGGNGDNGDNGNGGNGDNGDGGNGDGGNGDGGNGDGGNGDNGDNGDGGNGGNGDRDPTGNTNDGHGWLIWIYYPEGTAPINPPTLSESNVTVVINGKQLTDDDITGFARFIGADGERGIQFFYPTDSAELLDLQIQMIGITDPEGDVRFNINYLWHSY